MTPYIIGITSVYATYIFLAVDVQLISCRLWQPMYYGSVPLFCYLPRVCSPCLLSSVLSPTIILSHVLFFASIFAVFSSFSCNELLLYWQTHSIELQQSVFPMNTREDFLLIDWCLISKAVHWTSNSLLHVTVTVKHSSLVSLLL